MALSPAVSGQMETKMNVSWLPCRMTQWNPVIWACCERLSASIIVEFCDKPLFVAIHVAATTPAGAHETGWGKGSCYDTKGNCAKYWTFNTACSCPVIYDFEPITTTVAYVTTITTSSSYTVTFPSVPTTTTCDDPNAAQTTSHCADDEPHRPDHDPVCRLEASVGA